MARSARYTNLSMKAQREIDELDELFEQAQDLMQTIIAYQGLIMTDVDEPKVRANAGIREMSNMLIDLLMQIKEIDDNDTDINTYMTEIYENLTSDRDIDNESELYNKMWFKFTNKGNEYQPDVGTDIQFSYDTAFAKPWRPAFKPVQYSRNINGKKTFIANVRILVCRDNGKLRPISVPSGFTAPPVKHGTIQKPVIESYRFDDTIEKSDWKKIYTGRTGRYAKNPFFWHHGQPYKRGRYMPIPKGHVKDGRIVVEFHKIKVPVMAGFNFGYANIKGIDNAFSVQLAPPIERNDDGSVKTHYGYSPKPEFNLIGADQGWAEQMNKRFLADLKEGNVEVTRFYSWIEKRSSRMPAHNDNTKVITAIERTETPWGKIRETYVYSQMVYKHQAYKVYKTHIGPKIGGTDLNVLIYCDIKMISEAHFTSLEEVKQKKTLYPEVLFVDYEHKAKKRFRTK